MNRRAILAAAPAAALWPTVLAAGGGRLLAASKAPKVDEPAPDFHAATFDGGAVSLGDYKGQVLILNFWATWCGPCRTELPLLDAYYHFQQHFGLEVLGVTKEEQVPVAALAPLAKLVSFKMARRFSGPYGYTGQVPTNYVIDRAGVLRWGRPGAFDLDLLNDLIVPLLNRSAPVVAPQVS